MIRPVKNKLGVLIVEDEQKVAMVHRRFLERLPIFQLLGVANSGPLAWQAEEKLQPDLVLLDIYLPSMDGLQVLRAWRQRERPLDVIVISASQDPAMITQALRSGAIDYLIKPFTFPRFHQALEKYLRLRECLTNPSGARQPELDRFLLGQGQSTKLPKGIDRLTLEKILALFREKPRSWTVEEVSDHTGISHVTVRRYLEYLAQTGLLQVELAYGNVGRPVRLYRLG